MVEDMPQHTAIYTSPKWPGFNGRQNPRDQVLQDVARRRNYGPRQGSVIHGQAAHTKCCKGQKVKRNAAGKLQQSGDTDLASYQGQVLSNGAHATNQPIGIT